MDYITMRNKKGFSYNDKFHCDVLLFRGIAVDVNKSRTVHTTISGGGGSIRTGIDGKVYGGTSGIRSTTQTHIHDEFFLRNQTSGKEEDFSLTDWDIPLRDGHDAAVAWVVPHGNNQGPYIALHNYTLQKTTWRADLLPQMFQIKKPIYLWVLNVIVCIACFIMANNMTKWISDGWLFSLFMIAVAFCSAFYLNDKLYQLMCGARDAEIEAARKALSDCVVQMMNEAKP